MTASTPLFIVGCGRSGTTMLRLMLDSHPQLAIPGESHLIPAIWRCRGRYQTNDGLDVPRLAGDIFRSPHVGLWGLSEPVVRRRLSLLSQPSIADVIQAFYLAYADQYGKTRWGDKTPMYVMAIPMLASIFPTARFIHIIRDGRDVALSYLSRGMFPKTIWQASWRWNQAVSAGLKAGRTLGPERYIEVRYEDLVTDARTLLGRICSFADLPFDEAMLDYYEDVEDRLQVAPSFRRFQQAVTKPPVTGLRDWRTQMDAAHIRAFEEVNRQVLGRVGYEIRYPTPSRRYRIQARLAIGATRLRIGSSRYKQAFMRRLMGTPLGW
jgi:hypothetical protein